MTPQLPTVLDVATVATLLRCAETTVEERARRGDLPGLKIGDSWVFPAGALTAALDQLALDQAAERRKPARASGQLVDIKRKPKRTPPTLPSL